MSCGVCQFWRCTATVRERCANNCNCHPSETECFVPVHPTPRISEVARPMLVSSKKNAPRVEGHTGIVALSWQGVLWALTPTIARSLAIQLRKQADEAEKPAVLKPQPQSISVYAEGAD